MIKYGDRDPSNHISGVQLEIPLICYICGEQFYDNFKYLSDLFNHFRFDTKFGNRIIGSGSGFGTGAKNFSGHGEI